jgi:hypothetical protein
MGLNTQQYQKKPENIEVVELTKDNVQEVARWCGGTQNSVRNILHQDHALETQSLAIPSIYGGISAEIGTFIARNAETGVFSVMTKEHLDAEYQRIGLRQDGIFGNRNGQR